MGTAYKVGDRVEVMADPVWDSWSGWGAGTVWHGLDPSRGVAGAVGVRIDGHAGGDWYNVRAIRPIVARPTDPAPPADPLLCPRCSTPSHPVAMRTRGEVRSRVWQCGCAVRPDVVQTPEARTFRRGDPHDAGRPIERMWVATGEGAAAYHPTEAGAVAAWRVALEQRQREDDERAVQPAPAGETIGPQPWQRGALRSVLHAWAVRRSHAEVLGRFAPPSVPTGREVFGYAAADSAPDGTVTVNVGARSAGGDPAGKAVHEIMLTRERRVALCDRTDYEVRHAARACTADTDVETLVAVANECARRWPERVPVALGHPTPAAAGAWRFEIVATHVYLVDNDPGCAASWSLDGARLHGGSDASRLVPTVQRLAGVA